MNKIKQASTYGMLGDAIEETSKIMKQKPKHNTFNSAKQKVGFGKSVKGGFGKANMRRGNARGR